MTAPYNKPNEEVDLSNMTHEERSVVLAQLGMDAEDINKLRALDIINEQCAAVGITPYGVLLGTIINMLNAFRGEARTPQQAKASSTLFAAIKPVVDVFEAAKKMGVK